MNLTKTLCVLLALAACGPEVELAPHPVDTTAPTTPGAVVAMALSDSTIGLAWDAASDLLKLSHYRVYRDGSAVGTTTETRLTDTGLAGQTRYCYQVRSVDAAGNESVPSEPACATTAAPPARFPGFDFTLEQGDFWAYGWDLYENIASSSGRSATDRGMFYLRLGAPRTIAGLAMNAVELYGRTSAMGIYTERSFAPRWSYLGLQGSRLMGSKNGVTTEVVFDLQRGSWTGGGFFASFPADKLIAAGADNIDNPFTKGSALSASTAASQSQCEYFAGIGTICGGEVDSSHITKDYYREGVGPIGYLEHSFLSSCGGGYCSMHTHRYQTGLLGSSFTNYGFTPQQEAEPNDSRAAARDFPGDGNVLTGTVLGSDAATVTTLTSPQYTGLRLHDFFTVNHAGGPMSAELSFEAHRNADLDLFIFDAANNLVAYSISDNVQAEDFHELIRRTLPAGRYTVAVSGYVTPSRVSWNFQWL